METLKDKSLKAIQIRYMPEDDGFQEWGNKLWKLFALKAGFTHTTRNNTLVKALREKIQSTKLEDWRGTSFIGRTHSECIVHCSRWDGRLYPVNIKWTS